MRLALAFLLPAVLAGLTGCMETARSVGQTVAKAYPEMKIDNWALQPKQPVMIDGKRFEMTGIDRCPSIWPFINEARDCLTLSSDRHMVQAMLKGDEGVSQVILVSSYDDGRFTLNTLQGSPVLAVR